jgi:tRNA (guanine37-N1)-methyltransferase
MIIHLLTLFPEFFESPLQESILKRAQAKNAVQFNIVNIRDFASDKHQTTDDRPYGGGPGMVMKVEPIALALQSLKTGTNTKKILTSAKGKMFSQPLAQEYAKLDDLVIICGHYEGVDERVDERVVEHLIDEEVRIGDYVLTGGEPAAVVITDAVTRLLPGVLGNEASNEGESHSKPGFFAHPQYTRPEEFQGMRVPDVLLSGHHAEIAKWRAENGRKA